MLHRCESVIKTSPSDVCHSFTDATRRRRHRHRLRHRLFSFNFPFYSTVAGAVAACRALFRRGGFSICCARLIALARAQWIRRCWPLPPSRLQARIRTPSPTKKNVSLLDCTARTASALACFIKHHITSVFPGRPQRGKGETPRETTKK